MRLKTQCTNVLPIMMILTGTFQVGKYTASVGDTLVGGRTVLKLNSGRLGGWLELEGEARRSATGKVAHSSSQSCIWNLALYDIIHDIMI